MKLRLRSFDFVQLVFALIFVVAVTLIIWGIIEENPVPPLAGIIVLGLAFQWIIFWSSKDWGTTGGLIALILLVQVAMGCWISVILHTPPTP